MSHPPKAVEFLWRVSESPDSSHSTMLFLALPQVGGSGCQSKPYTLLPMEFEQGKLLAPTGRAAYWKDTTNNPLNTQGQKINTRQHLVVRREAKTIEKPGWHPAALDRSCFAWPTMDLLLYFIFSNTEYSSNCPCDTWLGRQITTDQLMWSKINFQLMYLVTIQIKFEFWF